MRFFNHALHAEGKLNVQTINVLKILIIVFLGVAISSSHSCSIILNIVFMIFAIVGLKKEGLL